jgi:hypothetical protein
MFDIIGDVHGHADELEALLIKLGYQENNGTYNNPGRTVIFIGDYIDRGPKIRETLRIVKAMVDSNNAIALMGNHEYNALCFHTMKKEGGYLRKHNIKNICQHFETLKQFKDFESEWQEYLQWFKSLPLFYENDSFRAVHACWDTNEIEVLKRTLVENCLNDELILASTLKGTPFHNAVETTLKGKEISMPEGLFFFDKDQHKRSEIRIKWWEDPKAVSLQSYSVVKIESLPKNIITDVQILSNTYYDPTDKPVFFGHYWFDGTPEKIKENVICIDYSVARGGILVGFITENNKFAH